MSPELRNALIKVVSSWEVIFITIAMVLYFFIVGRVSSFTIRKKPEPKPKKAKTPKTPAPKPANEDDTAVEEDEQH